MSSQKTNQNSKRGEPSHDILDQTKGELQLMEKSQGDKPATKYKKWLIENGKTFNTVDIGESEKAAKETNAQLKQCYVNALRGTGSRHYYEGYVISKSIPISIAHAWIVDDKGHVIDPTLILDVKGQGTSNRKGIDRIGDEYFGVEIPKHTAYSMSVRTGKFGPYLFDYFQSLHPDLFKSQKKERKQLKWMTVCGGQSMEVPSV